MKGCADMENMVCQTAIIAVDTTFPLLLKMQGFSLKVVIMSFFLTNLAC